MHALLPHEIVLAGIELAHELRKWRPGARIDGPARLHDGMERARAAWRAREVLTVHEPVALEMLPHILDTAEWYFPCGERI